MAPPRSLGPHWAHSGVLFLFLVTKRFSSKCQILWFAFLALLQLCSGMVESLGLSVPTFFLVRSVDHEQGFSRIYNLQL